MRAFDAALRVAGACIAVALAAMTALVEAFSTPRLWIIPMGAALLGNLALYWFARTAIGRAWAWAVPAVPWLLVMFVAVASTSEGDLIANSGTGLATFGAGAVGFFAPAALSKPPSRARPPTDGQGEEAGGVVPPRGL